VIKQNPCFKMDIIFQDDCTIQFAFFLILAIFSQFYSNDLAIGQGGFQGGHGAPIGRKILIFRLDFQSTEERSFTL
jgi:hypothetical protein